MMKPQDPIAYLKSQMVANLVINCLLNGGIAYFFYRDRTQISLVEIAVDIQITLAIIAFFVSWIAIATTRQKITGGQVRMAGRGTKTTSSRMFIHALPQPAVLRSLVIMISLMVCLGGLLLTGSLALLNPAGLSNGAYILYKTLYTGSCAALAAYLSIGSVYLEQAQ